MYCVHCVCIVCKALYPVWDGCDALVVLDSQNTHDMTECAATPLGVAAGWLADKEH